MMRKVEELAGPLRAYVAELTAGIRIATRRVRPPVRTARQRARLSGDPGGGCGAALHGHSSRSGLWGTQPGLSARRRHSPRRRTGSRRPSLSLPRFAPSLAMVAELRVAERDVPILRPVALLARSARSWDASLRPEARGVARGSHCPQGDRDLLHAGRRRAVHSGRDWSISGQILPRPCVRYWRIPSGRPCAGRRGDGLRVRHRPSCPGALRICSSRARTTSTGARKSLAAVALAPPEPRDH